MLQNVNYVISCVRSSLDRTLFQIFYIVRYMMKNIDWSEQHYLRHKQNLPCARQAPQKPVCFVQTVIIGGLEAWRNMSPKISTVRWRKGPGVRYLQMMSIYFPIACK